MRLTRRKKVALGLATAWPLIYVAGVTPFFVVTFLRLKGFLDGLRPRELPLEFYIIMLPLHALTALGMMALVVVYMLHALQNRRLEQSTRMLWVVLLFVGTMLIMPVYFFQNILPLEDDSD